MKQQIRAVRNGLNDSVKLRILQKNRRVMPFSLLRGAQALTQLLTLLFVCLLPFNALCLSGCKTSEKHQWVGDDEPIVMPSRTPPAVDSQQYSTENKDIPMDGDSSGALPSEPQSETESQSAIRLDNPEFKSSIPVKPKAMAPVTQNTLPSGSLQNSALRAPTVIAPPKTNNLYGVMPVLPAKPKRVEPVGMPLRLQPVSQSAKTQSPLQLTPTPVNVQQNSTFRSTPPNASGINYARERAANTPRPSSSQTVNTASPQSQPQSQPQNNALPQSQALQPPSPQQVQNASRPINLDPPPRRPALSSPHPLPNAIPHSAMPRPIAPNGATAAPVNQPAAQKTETTSAKPAKNSPFSALRSMTSKAVDKTKQLGQKFHKNSNAADPSANNTGRARIDLPEDSSR